MYAGASPTFSITATSPAGEPVSYYWFTNGVWVANATNAAYQLANVQLDSPTNFFCVASNVAGTTTGQIWSVTYVAAPPTPFAQAVLALNPVAYWRLNEMDDGSNDGNPEFWRSIMRAAITAFMPTLSWAKRVTRLIPIRRRRRRSLDRSRRRVRLRDRSGRTLISACRRGATRSSPSRHG
ncbi:MAG: hypothetical protein WDM76_16945 [Limisphaerales bacterium]